MLDNLRSMAVFACVVEKGSFSAAAREMGITTSAVSQQIRSLEEEMDVVLLHRSTRKLGLTEAGQAFFLSCQEMVAAAERGKIRINELRDDIVGELRIATTPELGAMHVVPALSAWMSTHPGLKVHIDARHDYIDLVEKRIDIAIRINQPSEDPALDVRPIVGVDQVLVASPAYLRQFSSIQHPTDLTQLEIIPSGCCISDELDIKFSHRNSNQYCDVHLSSRIHSNDTYVTKSLCMNGHGVARMMYLDVQKELQRGDLVEVLPQWKMQDYILYAVMQKVEEQPIKIQRCLDALSNYFNQLSTNRSVYSFAEEPNSVLLRANSSF